MKILRTRQGFSTGNAEVRSVNDDLSVSLLFFLPNYLFTFENLKGYAMDGKSMAATPVTIVKRTYFFPFIGKSKVILRLSKETDYSLLQACEYIPVHQYQKSAI